MRSLVALCLVVVLAANPFGGAAALRTAAKMRPSGSAAGPQGPLQKIVFAHRHCARTEIKDIGHGCGKIGCGMCTEQGKLMLQSTGEDFRRRYGSILPNEYLMDKFQSYSDGAPRTQQSSSAFLNGLFAYNSSYIVYPAINTDAQPGIDPWSSLPTYKLRNDINDAAAFLSALPKITQYINISTIKAIAKEIGLTTLACDVAHGAACVAAEIDYLYAARAEGKLSPSKFPVAIANWQELAAVRQFFEPYLSFGWQHFVNKDGFFTEAGYPGHPLLDAMLSAAADASGPVLTEFSGHDTTLMPLYAAMGNYTVVYPEFATSVVFEIYTNPSDGTNPFVLVKTALPDQLPGSHPLTWYEYNATCMSSTTGQIYTSSTGCPLKDLQAFANTRRGTQTGTLGGCYAFPKDLSDTLCTNKSGDKPFGPCKDYRAACPLTACGKGYYMKSDYSCNPV